MNICYVENHRTGLPHIYDHNVSEVEVEDVFDADPQLIRGRREARIALGRTSAGRYLKVIYLLELDGIRVITAYQLVGKPLRTYRRWLRRKHGKR